MNSSQIFWLVFALGGIGAIISCYGSSFFSQVQAASSPIGPASASAANSKLEEAVRSMFAKDEQVRNADLGVRADVTKNEVTLSGIVQSEAVRSRAIQLAKTAHAGVIVNDKMTVRPSRSKNSL
jgi:osmotically-inducible protein OsmY